MNEQLEFEWDLYALTEWQPHRSGWVIGFKYLTSKKDPWNGFMPDNSWAIAQICIHDAKKKEWIIRYYNDVTENFSAPPKESYSFEEAKIVVEKYLKICKFKGFVKKSSCPKPKLESE